EHGGTGDGERGPGAVDHAAQDIAAERIGPERMRPRTARVPGGRCQAAQEGQAGHVVRRDQWRDGCQQHEGGQDEAARPDRAPPVHTADRLSRGSRYPYRRSSDMLMTMKPAATSSTTASTTG